MQHFGSQKRAHTVHNATFREQKQEHVDPISITNFWTRPNQKHLRKRQVDQLMIPEYDEVDNIVGKEENDSYHHFYLFPQCFRDLSSTG